MVEYAVKGFVFHTTSPVNALKILIDGYLKPLFAIGEISFTLDSFLGGSVYPRGITFVFSETLIREKYGGKEPSYLLHIKDLGERKRLWEKEQEIAVTGKLVYISDAAEILTTGDVARKYGWGYKYAYKDIRYRLGTPWRAFRELAPNPPWQGPPEPQLFR